MAIVFMRDFFPVLLEFWDTFVSELECRLFKNDVEITEDLDLYDLEECDFGGYERLPLDDWGPAYLNPEFRGQKDHAYLMVNRSETGLSGPVYGYYLVSPDEYLVAAERDPAAPTMMETFGQPYVWRPRLTLRNDVCP